MPALRTEITEIVTGLGMLGADDLDALLDAEVPLQLRNVDAATWGRLRAARGDRAHDGDFLAAWNNGRAFFAAPDGLRGRVPNTIEWTGGHRDPGDSIVPADLRIDHVYLVSCKYLSKVLHNSSPAALFERMLAGGQGRRAGVDWFDEVAPVEHQQLYELVRGRFAGDLELPAAVHELTKPQRRELRVRIPRDWDDDCAAGYAALTARAAVESARRWRGELRSERERLAMIWRLLRLTSAPYFVLGTASGSTIRLRVGTPWDFTQAYRLRSFEPAATEAGQAIVGWRAVVRDLATDDDVEVDGHVEIRWSHGRFGGPPEAKVYLDTPHSRVPGYFPLTRSV